MDYVPKKDSDFVVWVKSLLAYAQAHLAAFNIQEAVFQPLLDLHTAWEAAYAKTIDPNRGAVDVAEKNCTREALEKALRNFIKAFLLYSPFVSDKDRGEMRLPIHVCVHGGQTGEEGVFVLEMGERQRGEGSLVRGYKRGRAVM